MSTRMSLYFWCDAPTKPSRPVPKSGIHVYREMHDNCIHLQLYRENSEVNVILTEEMWGVLKPRLIPDAP